MGFINGLASYLLLLVISVAVGGIGIFLGITMRKRANAKTDGAKQEDAEEA